MGLPSNFYGDPLGQFLGYLETRVNRSIGPIWEWFGLRTTTYEKNVPRANRVILRIFRDMKHLNFGWAPYRNLHGAGIWKYSGGGQKVNFFSKKKLCSEMIPKGFPLHPHHFFRQNWTNYTPIWAHFVACMMEFSCILAIPCSEKRFSRKIWSQMPFQNMQKASHIIKVLWCIFLIIFYGGSHMFHSDPRMRSMPNYLLGRENRYRINM